MTLRKKTEEKRQPKKARMPHTPSGGYSLPIGVVVSLFLNIVSLVFGGGVLYQRVLGLEDNIKSITAHNDKRDETLSKIEQTLARIDERLQHLTSAPVKRQ